MGESRCASCRIVADSMGYMGYPEEQDINIRWRVPPARDSRGQIFVSGSNSIASTAVFVFDSAGRYLHTIGRQGEGPGEFRGPIQQIQVGPTGLLYFFEPIRVHTFDANRRPERVLNVPLAVASALTTTTILNDGRIVRSTAPNQIAIIPATGPTSPPPAAVTLETADTTCRICGNRVVTRGLQRGTIWSMPANEYALDQHDLAGRLIVRLQRSAPWYRKWTIGQQNLSSRTPAELVEVASRTIMLAVRQESDGLIWTFIRVADPETPVPVGFTLPMDRDEQDEFYRKYFATYVEVIDPVTRQVLATRKFKPLLYPIGDGSAVRVDANNIGGGSFAILRLRLQR